MAPKRGELNAKTITTTKKHHESFREQQKQKALMDGTWAMQMGENLIYLSKRQFSFRHGKGTIARRLLLFDNIWGKASDTQPQFVISLPQVPHFVCESGSYQEPSKTNNSSYCTRVIAPIALPIWYLCPLACTTGASLPTISAEVANKHHHFERKSNSNSK